MVNLLIKKISQDNTPLKLKKVSIKQIEETMTIKQQIINIEKQQEQNTLQGMTIRNKKMMMNI